jgi:hypothetical protein
MAFTTRTGSYGKQSRLVSFASSERSIDARDARGGDGDAGEDRAGARGGEERERASERARVAHHRARGPFAVFRASDAMRCRATRRSRREPRSVRVLSNYDKCS